MKYVLFILIIYTSFHSSQAQKIDSIAFHLYTDSLKKGTHNYINIDGLHVDGKWKPLSSKEIYFTTSYGVFNGNELVIPADCKEEKVKVKAVLRSSPAMWKEMTIWIKKKPDDEKLPTLEEVMNKPPKKEKKKSKKN